MAFTYINNPDVREMIHQRMETIVRLSDELNQKTHLVLCLTCIEHILYHQFPPLSAETQTAWMLLLLNSTLSAYRPPTHLWQAILEREYRTRSLELPFILEYGRLLRRVQHWDKAQLVFEDAIFQAGQRGDFILQTHGMVEMATLLRIRGAYDKALRLLEESEKIATRYHASALLQTIYFEKTQIALDQRDPQTAAYYLEKLPESPRSLVLLAEFALLNNMLEVGIRAALSARQAYSTDRLKLSMIYILLGRLYTAAANYDLAHQYLALAVTLSEQLNDSFPLARAKANLALVFIHQDDKATALSLLQHAEKIQREINDHVGLAFTQHNLAWLCQ
jgi:tetratricopeptide (TPR) repeat protein